MRKLNNSQGFLEFGVCAVLIFFGISAIYLLFICRELSAGAVLLSATGALTIGLFTVHRNREIAKRAKTIDILHQTAWDTDFIEARAVFVRYKRKKDKFSSLIDIDPEEPNLMKDRTSVQKILNHYELMATGIKEGIISEETYKRFSRTKVTSDAEAVRGFIMARRKNIKSEQTKFKQKPSKLWCEFLDLADRWSSELGE